MTEDVESVESAEPNSRLRPVLLWALFLALCGVLVAGVAGWLEPVQAALSDERLSFSVGDFSFSAFDVARVIVVLALVYWIAAVIAGVLDQRIRAVKAFKSGTRSLIAQIVRIAIYIIAGLVTLDVVGLDLTALTVFGGALGIGVGFGLQKIASNFISGLILMAERSVEEGDLVELADGTMGFVRRSSAHPTGRGQSESKGGFSGKRHKNAPLLIAGERQPCLGCCREGHLTPARHLRPRAETWALVT